MAPSGANFDVVQGIGGSLNTALHEEGYRDWQDILEATPEELTEVRGLSAEREQSLREEAKRQISRRSEAPTDSDDEELVIVSIPAGRGLVKRVALPPDEAALLADE